MFLRNHVTQWLVITRWSGTLVVSGVDWTCDTAVQCFDPLSSHRPNSLIYETRQRNSTPSAFISIVKLLGDLNCQQEKSINLRFKAWVRSYAPHRHGPSKNTPARQRTCQILGSYWRKGEVCGFWKGQTDLAPTMATA